MTYVKARMLLMTQEKSRPLNCYAVAGVRIGEGTKRMIRCSKGFMEHVFIRKEELGGTSSQFLEEAQKRDHRKLGTCSSILFHIYHEDRWGGVGLLSSERSPCLHKDY